jgi:hypothetical protein
MLGNMLTDIFSRKGLERVIEVLMPQYVRGSCGDGRL